MQENIRQIEVAIGIICHQNRVLICKRKADVHLGGFWEFPGGKVELGETPWQSLEREIFEELAIHVDQKQAFPIIDHTYPDRRIRLYPFLCDYRSGEPTPLACDELRWVPGAELSDYRFPPANDDLIKTLQQLLPASGTG